MESKFWVFIGDGTGLPLAVEKRAFAPTINPCKGSWVEFVIKGDSPDTKVLERAKAVIFQFVSCPHAACDECHRDADEFLKAYPRRQTKGEVGC